MVSRKRIETEEQWNSYFDKGGQWEINGGPEQTRLFAEAFCKHTRLRMMTDGESLLDSSCALGDALPVFRKYLPNLTLYGSDLSNTAISRCRERFPDTASFFRASLEEIPGWYHIVYSSSTLEHFVNYKEISRILIKKCKYLYILVPYNEKMFGMNLKYLEEKDHVVTFLENSFDFLIDEKLAKSISSPLIYPVPRAWSWTLSDRVQQYFRNVIRFLLKRPIVRNRKIIEFEIESADRGGEK